MRENVYEVLKKIYGAILMGAFFAGFFPVIPFVVAIIVGGSFGEAVSLFLYKQYYPWVIAAASISVLVGWIATYVGKKNSSSDKKNSRT